LITILVTTLPYLVGFWRQGSDWVFTGFLFGVDDGNSYIAKMLAGSYGAWLFRTPYTGYPQNGLLMYFPLIILGKLAAPPGLHEQLVVIFHLFRFAGIILYVFATYDFLSIFIRERIYRRLGTVLAVFGGGLGWLSVFGLSKVWGGQMPLEFYSPESFGFLMVYGLPHLAWARAFFLWGMGDYLRRAPLVRDWRSHIRTALIWLVVGLMQPLSILTAWAVIAGHQVVLLLQNLWKKYKNQPVDWQQLKIWLVKALRVGLLSSPFVIYTAVTFLFDPFFRKWGSQNILSSPPLLDYGLAFALVLPLAALGFRPLLRSKGESGLLVAAWVLISPFLAYLPVTVQRRLPEGIWVALLILALKAIEDAGLLAKRWAPRWLAFGFIPSILLLLGSLIAVWSPQTPMFRPVDEIRLFQYLASQPVTGEVVLASFDTSNPLPAWAPFRTLIGHGPESPNGPELNKAVKSFFQASDSDDARKAVLAQFSVSYVIWGPLEKEASTWDPSQVDYLTRVYRAGQYSVYRVIPASAK
jgi:hypothetical protein